MQGIPGDTLGCCSLVLHVLTKSFISTPFILRFILSAAFDSVEVIPRLSTCHVNMPKYLCVKIKRACWPRLRPKLCSHAHHSIQQASDERREFWFSIPCERYNIWSESLLRIPQGTEGSSRVRRDPQGTEGSPGHGGILQGTECMLITTS